jgi:hypothetical protein
MRANEFLTEKLNSDILNPNFYHEQEINGLVYSAKTVKDGWNPRNKELYLSVECNDKGRVVAGALFIILNLRSDQWLESVDTWVNNEYQQSGIASTMYAYAKMLGNDVRPSTIQTPDGKAMWKAWKKSGNAKHLMR